MLRSTNAVVLIAVTLLAAPGCARAGQTGGPSPAPAPATPGFTPSYPPTSAPARTYAAPPAPTRSYPRTPGPTTACAAPPVAPGVTSRADIFAAILRRYLTTGESSFSPGIFPVVYVMDRADAKAAEPGPSGAAATEPISPADQRRVVELVHCVAPVTFASDRDALIDKSQGCWLVRNGGILITLAPPVSAGAGGVVHVGINGFVACLGASWLTYVVAPSSSGWTVTGTTGTITVA